MTPECNLEDSITTLSQDILTHIDASPYQVWLWQVKQFRKVSFRQTCNEVLTFISTLTFSTAIIFTRQYDLWWRTIKQCLVAKRIRSSKDIIEAVTFWFDEPCDLDLKDSNQHFLHDIPAYGDVSPYKVWLQKIQLKLHSNQILSLDTLAYDALPVL